MNTFVALFLVTISLVCFQCSAQLTCEPTCANLSVEYPFGISDGCGNPSYRLTCNNNASLQLGDSAVQSINYTARSISLSASRDSGCPLHNIPSGLQICRNTTNKDQVVCLVNNRSCCVQRQEGSSPSGCTTLYNVTDRASNTNTSVQFNEFHLVWNQSVASTCTGCRASKGQCGYNTTEGGFVCICGPSSNTTKTCESKSQTTKPIVLSGSLAIAVIVVVLVFGVSLSIYWKWKKNGREDEPSPIFTMDDPQQQVDTLREILSSRRGDPAKLFTLGEIDKATNGFAKEQKIGTGGFGTVYRGVFEDGSVLAIKRANHTSKQSSKHFYNEVAVLSQVNHRNLVRLMGCAINTDVPILVYEYVPNGTLFEHLHKKAEVLSWSNRLRIAIETAEALAYLHSAAIPPIYHRDVKSANILLDNNFTAKVADFGLSRLVPMDVTHVSTMVQGTPGYVDPEYHQTYQLTDKSDVYSFGVVLLEMVTGRKPVDFSRSSRDVNLSAYSVPLIQKGMLEEIMDPRLEVHGDMGLIRSIKSVANIAVACLQFYREDRPTMKQVLEELLAVRGLAGLAQTDHHCMEEGEVVLSDSYNPSTVASYNSVGSSNSRSRDAELTPR